MAGLLLILVGFGIFSAVYYFADPIAREIIRHLVMMLLGIVSVVSIMAGVLLVSLAAS